MKVVTEKYILAKISIMKKASYLLVIMFFMFIFTGAYAELPALTNGYPSVDLPQTFSLSNQGGYIDLDGDGIDDYLVTFETLGGGNLCLIGAFGTQSSGSGNNSILTEFEAINPPVSTPAKLGIVTPGATFCKILQKGEMVGPEELYDEAVWFQYKSAIMYTGGPVGNAPALGSNNYADDVYSGYLGTYFSGETGWLYGWINVEIDPAHNWVTLHSSGIGTAPETAVPAGLGDPYSVPVPLIASIFGFGLIGSGVYLKRRKKTNK